MGEVFFRTEGLTIGYNNKPLINNINLELEKGRIMTLVGPNGAGKTTFIKSICGFIKPLSGKVTLGGKDIYAIERDTLAKQLAVVLTEKSSAELMTCREIVAMGRYPYTGRLGKLLPEDEEIVTESMEQTGTLALAERDYDKISDGQRQRLLLARALCQRPEIMILDEPTSFLDVRYKMEFLSVLRTLARKLNFAVILSLHELDMARQVADKIVCVKGDKIDRIASPEEIFSGGYVKNLFDITVGDFDESTGLGILPKEE